MGATLKFGTIVISIKSPEREPQPALQVHWCEVLVKRKSDGQVLYRNSWITNHQQFSFWKKEGNSYLV
jgi:hypothetical protein